MFSKQNSGFTLVELLVTIAILGFVILAIGGALVSSAKSYRSGNVEVDLQQQSQITANLISSLVQDASDVSYVGGKLEIKQLTSTGEIVYTIQQQGTNLVYSVTGTSIVDDNTEELLAEHLTTNGFIVDDSTFDTTKNVAITLEFEEDGKTFKTTYNMTARNGNGTGSTALLAVRDVVLEPGEVYPFESVANRTLSWGDLGSSCGSTLVPTSTGAEVRISKTETASMLTFNVTTVPADASETAKTQTVHIYIRRVAKVDLQGTPDAGPYSEGTNYVVRPLFTNPANTNLHSVANADRGAYNYREFEDVEWSVAEGSSLIRNWAWVNYTTSDSTTSCVATFTLDKTLVPGEKIVIEAKAIRPSHGSHPKNWAKGYGLASNPDTGEVIGRFVIEKKDDIRRGTPYDFPKTEDQDEPQIDGFQKRYMFRFSNPDMLNKDDPNTWAGREWFTDAGVDTAGSYVSGVYKPGKYRIQGNTLSKMDPTKNYLIQMAFLQIPNGDQSDAKGRQIINSYTSVEFDKYVTTFQVDAASIKLQNVTWGWPVTTDTSVLGQPTLGAESAPYPIKMDQTTEITFEALAHCPDYFKSNMYVAKMSYKDGSGWHDLTGDDLTKAKGMVSFDNANDTEGKMGKIKFTMPQNYKISGKIDNNTELKIVFDWNHSSVANEGSTMDFYNEATGDGIFYIKLTN